MKIPSAFEAIREEALPEYRGAGWLLRHKATGCEILSIENDDKENFFCFGLRTPPADNTGTPHILEHASLAGSKAFPVKDPFVSLMKGSMQTFLNAMTYPDKTLYPAASVLEKDFFNLMAVYGDAVFFPLLKKETFQQEGWRYTLTGNGLQRVGVVLNEMKGAYASHENFAFDWSAKSLFPKSCYRFDSGGDPAFIPSLSYETFKAYHAAYYHPSNCKIFLYGSIPTAQKLAFIEEKFLSRFIQPRLIDSMPQDEPAFKEPARLFKAFPAQEGESPLCTVSVNWLACPVSDIAKTLALETLSHILLGSSGAKLYLRLQQSRLGQDLSPISGVSLDYKRALFSAALREVKEEDAPKAEPLVFKALAEIAEAGLGRDEIESALRSVEFSRRELKNGPMGLRLMGRIYRAWNYGADPLKAAGFNAAMAGLRQTAFAKGFFEGLIREYFLENRHYSAVITKPDFALHGQLAAEEAAELQRLFQGMGSADLEAVRHDEAALKAYQEMPDNGGLVPHLHKEDAPKRIAAIDSQIRAIEERPLIAVEPFANGICYWRAAFEAQDLSKEELMWLPFFCRAASGLGWQDGTPYDEASRLTALHTGGLSVGIDNGRMFEGGQGRQRKVFVALSLKALPVQLEKAAEIAQKTLSFVDFSDHTRLKDLYFELYNDMKNAVGPSGSGVAALRLSRFFSECAYIDELWFGAEQLFFLEGLQKKRADSAFWQETQRRFEELQAKLFVKARLASCYAADAALAKETLSALKKSLARLPQGNPAKKAAPLELPQPFNEGLQMRSSVNYVGLMLPARSFDTKERAAETLLAHFLSSGALWEAVRMKGGAYGVSASAGGLENYFTFTSYRDPNLAQTIAAFQNSLQHFAGITEKELEEALIGRIGREERPLSPAETLGFAFKRFLYATGDELRQRMRNRMLEATPQEIQDAAGRLASYLHNAPVCVLGGQSALREARKAGLLQKIRLIPS